MTGGQCWTMGSDWEKGFAGNATIVLVFVFSEEEEGPKGNERIPWF